MGLASLIKNGPELNVKIKIIDDTKNLIVNFYHKEGLVKSTSSLTFSLPVFPANQINIALMKDDVILAFGGDSAVLTKLEKQNRAHLFYDEENIDAVIDNALLGGAKFCPNLTINPLSKLLVQPLIKRPPAAYFSKYKLLIYEILNSCPKDRVLSSMFDNSVWARTKTRFGHIVVGLIFNKTRPEIVAFGYPTINEKRNIVLDKKLGQTTFVKLPGNNKFGYYLSLKLASNGKNINFFEKF